MKRTIFILGTTLLLSCTQTKHVQSDNFPQTFEQAEAYADSLLNEPFKGSIQSYQ